MESLIAENITKQFDGNTVLDNISFTVEPGEFLSILGPSGCGKTTLLRILIGLLEPDSGKLLLDGRDITHVAPDKRSMGSSNASPSPARWRSPRPLSCLTSL